MDLLRLNDAEKELGISRSTLKRWIKKGHIKSVTTHGGHHRIPLSEIERMRGATDISDEKAVSGPELRPHVLVVDDVKDTREVVQFWLNNCGYEVTTATDAAEALKLARELSVDAYVLDNVIQGTSGIDLCRRIRENDPLTPVIFFSAFDDHKQALDAKAQAYVRKPDVFELQKTLDYHFPQKRQADNPPASLLDSKPVK